MLNAALEHARPRPPKGRSNKHEFAPKSVGLDNAEERGKKKKIIILQTAEQMVCKFKDVRAGGRAHLFIPIYVGATDAKQSFVSAACLRHNGTRWEPKERFGECVFWEFPIPLFQSSFPPPSPSASG